MIIVKGGGPTFFPTQSSVLTWRYKVAAGQRYVGLLSSNSFEIAFKI